MELQAVALAGVLRGAVPDRRTQQLLLSVTQARAIRVVAHAVTSGFRVHGEDVSFPDAHQATARTRGAGAAIPPAFLRFHEGLGRPHPCYGRSALQGWVERLADNWGTDAGIWVYFNNDPRACALRDARTFGRMAVAAGFEVTRTPGPSDVRIDLEGSEGWSTSEYQERLKL